MTAPQDILLNAECIKSLLSEEIGITVLETTTSTNDYFKTPPRMRSIHCCLAEMQTEGRGRLHRSWHSPFAQNLYLSCYYPFQKALHQLGGLSVVVSLSVLRTLQAFGCSKDTFVKWPNDVLCQGRKISGILIETQGKSEVTIGIGLNVNLLPEEGAPAISQAWTSLREIAHRPFDRNQVAGVLLQYLLKDLRRFEQEGLEVFLAEWQAADALRGRSVRLQAAHEQIRGEVLGIDAGGRLCLRLPDGSAQAFSAGEVSILK